MKVVIMAGGKGTRISSVASDIPKPMIKIGDRPVLQQEIECLRYQGFTDIVITVSHLGKIIMDYFGDGSKFGVNIEYYFEEEPLGNAGALFKIKDKLDSDFLLLNADSIFDIDFNRFVKFHQAHKGLVTILTHPNNHPYDSGLIVANSRGIVEQWLTKEELRPEYYNNRVNAGIHIISPEILNMKITTKKVDLDRQLLKPLTGTGKMLCYDSTEYIKDMGTPDRYFTICKDYNCGIVSRKNLRNKQKAIFLDRDGTINKYVGFVKTIGDFQLNDGVGKAISLINNTEYLTVVVTNQPVVARGETSIEQLDRIHKKMETLLGKQGAYIDGLYYCPHHPDKGYAGEVVEYKIKCDCRKPKPGLLLKAAEDLNIDLEQSWMIGDSECDILAGKASGCRTVLIGNENYGQDYTSNSLLTAIEGLL